jgi:hypothetical protein
MPAPVLRMVNGDGSLGRVLPGWTSLSVGGDLGEQMVLTMDYRTDHPTYPLLDDLAQVAVTIDGEEIPDGRFVIDELTDEEVLEQDVLQRSGNSTLFGLHYAIVYPESWTLGAGNVSTPGHGFANQSPGLALRELLEAAQLRGWWPSLTWDFSDAADSSGAAWLPNVSDFYDQGTTLLDIVTKWKTRKVAVARMNAGVLQLFRYENSGDDLSLDIQLFRDVDLSEGPVQRTSRNTVSVILGVTDAQDGGAGFGVERVDNPALSQYGRREGFVSQSQVPDSSTLTAIVDGTLALKARQREAFTYGLTCLHPSRLPLVHWDRGDLVTLRVAGQDRVMRVRQLTVDWDKNGEATGSAAFGDRKMDVEEQLAQRLEQLAGGSMDGGVFGPPLVGTPDTAADGSDPGDTSPDAMPPAAPTGLGSSTAAVFNLGNLTATATLQWTAPDENQDGTDLNDLGSFEVQYRDAGFPNWVAGGRYSRDTTQAVVQRLTVGAPYDWRVRALDIWGNASAWATAAFTATNDAVAPSQQPSAPAVTTFLFSGLMVTWDGKAQGGTAIDNDIRHVEVHVSATSGFAPSAGTLKDRIDIGGGTTVVGELTPGTTYYVKFRSVDWAGNIGPVSLQSTGVPDAVQGGDIANGAVTDAKMTSVSATKITAGILSAVITLSGEFRTADTGQRAVMNLAGFKLYNSAGNVVVNLDATAGQGTFNGILGAMNVSGYVRVDSGIGPFLLMQNIGTVPALAFSTGRLIEKYPSYMYTTSDAFLRSLAARWNGPGTAYQAGPDVYEASNITLLTFPYDGDFANATTLPTAISGEIRLQLPSGNFANRDRSPKLVFRSKYANVDHTNFHLYPALMLMDASEYVHTVAMRVDGTGNSSTAAELTICNNNGFSFAPIRASAFNVGSGMSVKSGIEDVPFSAVDVIRNNPAKRWRYTQEEERPENYVIGPMGDDLPVEVRSVSQTDPHDVKVNLASMIGVLWRAVEELSERVDQMGVVA